MPERPVTHSLALDLKLEPGERRASQERRKRRLGLPEALEALQAATFDLLLTDIVMPQLDGIALALKVGKEFPASQSC